MPSPLLEVVRSQNSVMQHGPCEEATFGLSSRLPDRTNFDFTKNHGELNFVCKY
jgi:hypothetical protein